MPAFGTRAACSPTRAAGVFSDVQEDSGTHRLSGMSMPKGFGGPGGYSTFIHTNFLTNYSSISGNTELLRYINNTTDYVELSEKIRLISITTPSIPWRWTGS